MLIAEAVAEDDGVVDGQRQLQDNGDRVGDKADGAAQEVGAHVQQGGGAEGHDQNRDLGVGAGGQRQHKDNDNSRDDDDDDHLTLQIGRGIVADLRVDRGIVAALQLVTDLLQGVLGALVPYLSVKADGKKGRCILVMILGVIKFDRGDTLDVLDLRLQVKCGVVGDV